LQIKTTVETKNASTITRK